MKLKEKGFTTVELIIVTVVVFSLAAVSFYVFKNKGSSKSNAQATASTTQVTSVKLTPEQTLYQLMTALKSKDQSKFNSLLSPAAVKAAKAKGISDIYKTLINNQFYLDTLTKVDFSKEKAITSNYTSKTGVKGTKLTYTVATTLGTLKGTATYTFRFIPNGNGWLLDDSSFN